MSGRSFSRPQVTMIGASAMSGTVWDTFIHGSRPRSATRQRSIRIASPRPIASPNENPMAASWKVYQPFFKRNRYSGSRARPSLTSSNSSPAMSVACGIVRSSVDAGSSIDVPGQWSSVWPPIHLYPSQRATTRSSATTVVTTTRRVRPPFTTGHLHIGPGLRLGRENSAGSGSTGGGAQVSRLNSRPIHLRVDFQLLTAAASP